MVTRENRKMFMFYPEDRFKIRWDIFISLILIFTCIITPYRIAFFDQDSSGWAFANYFVDFMFLADILIIFNSAQSDEDYKIIDDRWEVAVIYFKTWFTIDLLAIIPFDLIVQSTGFAMNDVVRIARIGRMYKLMKLTRLVRILKIVE